MENHILEKLFTVIQSRESADPVTSYTAKLLAGNVTQVAKKVGEEAVETALAAVSGSKENLISKVLILARIGCVSIPYDISTYGK